MKNLFAAAAVLLLTGCATMGEGARRPPAPAPAPVVPLPPPTSGAIYQSGHDLSLFADTRARQVGDILTVVLVERTNAKKSASTNANKENSVDIGVPSMFGKTIKELSASLEAERKFTGGGGSSQSNSLDGYLTVTVIERLPNGNLRVQGEKQLELNQGDETVSLTGVVRPADIAPDNSVPSSRVAEARISYAGSGALADSNAPGWLSRFFNSPWWPF